MELCGCFAVNNDWQYLAIMLPADVHRTEKNNYAHLQQSEICYTLPSGSIQDAYKIYKYLRPLAVIL